VFDDENVTFKVVVNQEEQYSLRPAGRVNPPGWPDEGTQGSRQQCLARISVVWTDMRPLSARQP
jgi:MbtH protein